MYFVNRIMTMRILAILFILFIGTSSHPQQKTNVHFLDSAFLRDKIKGNIKQTLRWTDRLGDNYLVLTETDAQITPPAISNKNIHCKEGCTNKEIYAYHFINRDSLLWKLTDFVNACSFDNILEYRNGATKITDLDKNGLAEIWIMYSMTCTSDVSPRSLKLILYQGNKKYAIRGTSQPSPKTEDVKYGGKYVPDKEFQTLPQSFKDFAKKLWDKYLYDID
jgi:hypothetical protein